MNNKTIERQLLTFTLFKDLSEEEIESIVATSKFKVESYQPKSFVFMQGEPLKRVFFICSGKVKIYKTDRAGNEQIVAVLEAGDMFPHAGFFMDSDFPAHAEVIEPTELISVCVHRFEEITLSYPDLNLKMYVVLGKKILELQGRLEEKILNNTYEQIIMLLQRLSQSNGVKINDHYKLNSQFTNQELANMIGTSRETMNRTLNHLRKKGLIDQDQNGYYLIHLEKLENELHD